MSSCSFCTTDPNGRRLSCTLSASALLTNLTGVSAATKASPSTTAEVRALITQQSPISTSPLDFWRTTLLYSPLSPSSHRLATLLFAISMLKDLSYHPNLHDRSQSLQQIWTLVHTAITQDPPATSDLTFTAVRSAQGFLSIALSSIITSGQISELIRFHVWLADGHRGIDELAIHAHQPWAQSWILAGKGTDISFDATPADNDEDVFQEHVPRWFEAAPGKGTGEYKTHQMCSKVVPNGRFVRVRQTTEEMHSLDMSYVVPAGAFHRSMVVPDEVHATLFFFDAKRGFVKDAAVLGPREGKEYTQMRGVGASAKEVAQIVYEKREAELRKRKSKIDAGKIDYRDAETRADVGVIRYCRDAIYGRWLGILGIFFSKTNCNGLGKV